MGASLITNRLTVRANFQPPVRGVRPPAKWVAPPPQLEVFPMTQSFRTQSAFMGFQTLKRVYPPSLPQLEAPVNPAFMLPIRVFFWTKH